MIKKDQRNMEASQSSVSLTANWVRESDLEAFFKRPANLIKKFNNGCFLLPRMSQ